MKIEKKIMQKSNSGLLGFSLEDKNRNLLEAGMARDEDDSRGEEGEEEGDYLLGADWPPTPIPLTRLQPPLPLFLLNMTPTRARG